MNDRCVISDSVICHGAVIKEKATLRECNIGNAVIVDAASCAIMPVSCHYCLTRRVNLGSLKGESLSFDG